MQMGSGRAKTKLENDLSACQKGILTEDGEHKHDKGWDVADQYGCGERITLQINVKYVSFPHFSCILGKCKSCDEKDYQAPEFKLKRDKDSIRYSLFNSHSQCSIRKNRNIQYHDEKPQSALWNL